MLNPVDLTQYVIVPVLEYLHGRADPAPAGLLLGTALVESRLEYLHQIRGPALGLWQMEPATHKDIWINFLRYRNWPTNKIKALVGAQSLNPAECSEFILPAASEMIGNLNYACAMARVHYLRVLRKIPSGPEEQALYHKEFYNTPLGATKVTESIPVFEMAHGILAQVKLGD